MVNGRGIKSKPEKIKALIEVRSSHKPKNVQSFTKWVADLSRFVSKTFDKYLPLLKILKKGKKFKWSEECEEVFRELKRYLGQALLISKPKAHESLLLYLAISEEVIIQFLQEKKTTTN